MFVKDLYLSKWKRRNFENEHGGLPLFQIDGAGTTIQTNCPDIHVLFLFNVQQSGLGKDIWICFGGLCKYCMDIKIFCQTGLTLNTSPNIQPLLGAELVWDFKMATYSHVPYIVGLLSFCEGVPPNCSRKIHRNSAYMCYFYCVPTLF